MNAEYMKLLYNYRNNLEVDLEDLTILMKRKRKEYLTVQSMINIFDEELNKLAKGQEKVIIDCVDIGDEDES